MFEGQYEGQSHTKRHWVGLSRKGSKLAVDFRSELGKRDVEVAGMELGKSGYQFTCKDDSVFVLSNEGSLGVYSTTGFKEHECKLPKGSEVIQMGVHKGSLYALVQRSAGAFLASLEPTGKIVKQLDFQGVKIAGNASLLGDRLYFNSAGSEELTVCDLKQMSVVENISVPGVHAVHKMVGAYRKKWAALLLMAHLDESGKSRSVILLDPKTGEQVTICSANQPNSDALLAGERVVVSTSSTYQNVIRVFEPLNAEAEQKAA